MNGHRVVPFHGPHQAVLTTRPGAFASFVALDLRDGTDRDRLAAWMRLLTDDAARLTQGRAALADVEPELAATPAGLTVTVGFGKGFVDRARGLTPEWLGPLPAFSVDRLEERWSGGDALIAVAADEPVTVAHALRMLLKDSRAFATIRWRQDGFRRAYGSDPTGRTMRNLFGQLDGSANPAPGTGFVLRRIAMDLDVTGASGLPVISSVAHARRAHVADAALRIVRLAYNYEEAAAPGSDALSSAGLLFGAFQADVNRQFVPIQRALDEADLLNVWTTPVGSAVFAIPPGCRDGGFLGDTLLVV